MRIAIDTSALAKRYIDEPGTARIVELCAGAREIVVSVLCIPELISGLNRLRRERVLSSRKYEAVKKELIGDLAQATIAQITPSLISRTVEILERTELRALDAVHVATALDYECNLFVSADLKQCRAGKMMGLNIERIG